MSKWTIITVLAAVACAAPVARARKRERDRMAKDAVPAARAAEAHFKAARECELAVVLDASLETEDQIVFARYIADEVSSGAPRYCTDADSRRALCRMRTLKIAAASQPSFTFDDGVGTATTNGRGNPSWDTITRA